MLITSITGVSLITNFMYLDTRGLFSKLVSSLKLQELNLSEGIREISYSQNKIKGTFRGFHGSPVSSNEYKFVSCISGGVQDYVIDFRKQSDTYLDHVSIELSDKVAKTLLIPPGCLHGYLTLEDSTTLVYGMTAEFNEEIEVGVRFDDPKIGINLPSPIEQISQKDLSYEYLH